MIVLPSPEYSLPASILWKGFSSKKDSQGKNYVIIHFSSLLFLLPGLLILLSWLTHSYLLSVYSIFGLATLQVFNISDRFILCLSLMMASFTCIDPSLYFILTAPVKELSNLTPSQDLLSAKGPHLAIKPLANQLCQYLWATDNGNTLHKMDKSKEIHSDSTVQLCHSSCVFVSVFRE